ncbi:MAG TPA: hypothetical protein VGP17_14630 [Solirubrobacteraceae bacterium]|jgi:hypothetical protein|nr:hypothetical protein [Solirubrobacteraceae bacterium]
MAWLLLGFALWGLKSLHQLARVDIEALGDLEQVMQVEIAATALNLTEERPMDIAAGRQCFLAQAQGFPVFANALTKDLGCRG